MTVQASWKLPPMSQGLALLLSKTVEKAPPTGYLNRPLFHDVLIVVITLGGIDFFHDALMDDR